MQNLVRGSSFNQASPRNTIYEVGWPFAGSYGVLDVMEVSSRLDLNPMEVRKE
jgi:hypothetical protein